MANRGGQPGNKNPAKGRMFEGSLVREILARDLKNGSGKTLRKAAAALIDGAIAGDLGCIRELADRLDGRPGQSIAMTAEIKRSAAELSDDELATIIAGDLPDDAD